MIKNYFVNGKRFYRVDVKVRDDAGNQITRSRKGITNERKAQETEFEFNKELESRTNKSNSYDWRAWLAECLSRMKLTCAPSTVFNFRGSLEKWTMPTLGTKKLTEITRNDVYHVVFEYFDVQYTMNARKDLLKKIKRILQMAVDSKCYLACLRTSLANV